MVLSQASFPTCHSLSPAECFVLFASLDSRVKILGVFSYCQMEPPRDSGNTCRLIKLSKEGFLESTPNSGA